ncbi:helix-turn-helix domain-containing protein [Pseudochelatococcus lubricantis]|uniref:transcriptional activator FtrB n=1 Tax=Pseudochelatococcus lubricantis TaxID=1538102 RepID=UPI0035EABA3E
MRTTDLDRIRALPLFAGAEDDTFNEVTGGAFLQRFPAGTTLLLEGDPVDFLYVLLDGQVELQGTWKEKETTLAVLRPVSTFILAAVVLDATSLMGAVTLDRSEILMISGNALRRGMKRDAAFCFEVSQELAGCYRGLVRSVKNLKLRSAVERLANYLVTLQVRQGGGIDVTIPHEKRVLASLLGMTPENLSRAFAKLDAYGVVVDGNRVRLGNPDKLSRLARPSAWIDNHTPPIEEPLGKAERERWPLSGAQRSCA